MELVRDIWEYIIVQCLDVRSALRLSTTCRGFLSLCSSTSFWRRRVASQWLEVANTRYCDVLRELTGREVTEVDDPLKQYQALVGLPDFVRSCPLSELQRKGVGTLKKVNVFLVGESQSGKSVFFHRMHKPSPSRKDPFPQYLPTISVDLIKTAWQPKIGGDPIVVYVWDSAGSNRFWNFSKPYLSLSHAAIVVANITNKRSVDRVEDWLDHPDYAKGRNLTFFVLVNIPTSDESQWVTTLDAIQATCRKKGALMLCGNIANEAQCIKIFQSVANVTTFCEFPEAVYDRVELGWKPLPNRGSSIDGDDSFFDSLVKKFKSLFS